MKKEKMLHYRTITPLLRTVLVDIMSEPLFTPFALAGGTSLSLRYGHRQSEDIDLFTNADYGSLDFTEFEAFFRDKYPYYHCTDATDIVGFGRTYYVGRSKDDSIKVDMFYHDDIANPYEEIDGLRLVSAEDVAAMKIDVISRKGRKKDFWDIHELLDHFTIEQLLELHRQRREWDHDRRKIIGNLTDFSLADEYIDPVCLKGKSWGLIKEDFYELAALPETDE